jgi:cytoskeleton protein RodZ
MTDADQQIVGLRVPSDNADGVLADKTPSVGQQLQRARLEAGMSLESLSARLKISVQRLQAFEQDQFEKGPNLQIGRAMVASVARFLGLDPHSLLAQLPQPAPQGAALGMQEAARGFSQQPRLTMHRDAQGHVPSVWWVALALVVLAALLYFYPQMAQMYLRAPTAAHPEIAAPAAPIPQAGPQEALGQSASNPSPLASLPAVAVAPDPGASAVKLAQSVLLLKARGSTWIEVTDAKGALLLRRTLAAAEVVEVGGDLPLSVVVGRADHTEVVVRGVPFPLDTHTQDNVARFKVP